MTTPTTEAEPEGLDAPFPWDRKCPFSPPEQYAQLAAERPIAKARLATGREAWLVTGYHNIRQLLTDPRVSSSRREENFPFYFPIPEVFRTETSFIGYDPPEHTRTRRKAAVTFTNRRTQMLRPQIEKIVDETIDRLIASGSPADLHHELSLPIPMTVICLLLGIPYEDHEFFQKHGAVLLAGDSTTQQRQAAMVEVGHYLENLIAIKEKTPGDDLLSRAIVEYRESGEEYETRDLVNLCRLLMNGGHETTASMISIGTACLLEHPEELAKIKADPSLVPTALEEVIRFLTIGDAAIARVAMEDIEIGGVTIPKGDGILCVAFTGNRDPEVYEEPDKLILERGSRKHLGFGHGLHHCIGADLARLELEIVWSKLFQRLPDLRLAVPYKDIRTKEGAVIYGVWELPVEF
ncbi:cytochrome P450 [Streptomyces sp. DH37]|uniref:cytochrome P450 n=1 Tax=Streptomyces sp. DH37 TaxID=3040122 RepID=UPI002442CD40|nr:cytochrome P450 [Streptomyces sp. DH37]MDG9706405.1 cytochrome P450 [Streptomyces sp. DH37]